MGSTITTDGDRLIMATKNQVLQWAKAQNIDTEGLTLKEIEAALDRETAPRPGYTFAEVVKNNARAIVQAVRGE